MLQLGLTIAMIRNKNYKELQEIFEEFEIFSSPPIRLRRLEGIHKGFNFNVFCINIPEKMFPNSKVNNKRAVPSLFFMAKNVCQSLF